MKGTLQIIIHIILFFGYQFGKSYQYFNLYHTEERLMLDSSDHHCFYFVQQSTVSTFVSTIPFCIRPEILKNENNENKSCYGERITFDQLKSMNVTADDLLHWNAAIEIIDLYEKYLLLPNLIDVNEYYCNCSSEFQFGKFCEYLFNDYDLDENVYELTFTDSYEKTKILLKQFRNHIMTYYIGIACQTKFDHLDWRQICNGIVDCDQGEDEPFELCLQMELNQCHTETEARCQNGLCIPISLWDDDDGDCPDQSDYTQIMQNKFNLDYLSQCFIQIDLDCVDINLGWKKFSCGHNQFISYANFTLKLDGKPKLFDDTCRNNGHVKYLKKLFYSKIQDECWKIMMCLTGFNYLFPNIICLNDQIENKIKKFCPNHFYFPPNSVVYSFVYFQYETMNRTDWVNYTGPNYICYKKEYCQQKITLNPTILKDDLICFYINQTIFSWMNFYEYVTYLFNPCYSNFSTSIILNNKFLYKCHLSDAYISIHRLKDKVKDCFFNEDEDLNVNLCSFNTNDLFKCFTNENECIRQAFVKDKQNDCIDRSDEYFPDIRRVCNDDDSCQLYTKYLTKKKIFGLIAYGFHELCNKIVNRHLFSMESNETDETDCDYWPFTCDSPLIRCDGIWNCPNGIDEINCPFDNHNDYIRNIFNCSENENYCIQFINNNTDIDLTCINVDRTGDGIIDCIGGTDERFTNICTQLYPLDTQRHFLCMNSSVCLRPNQVCDKIIDCPYEDDERVCPWLFKSNTSEFHCPNSLSKPIPRCRNTITDEKSCSLRENIWFCDLRIDTFSLPDISANHFDLYPKSDQKIHSDQLLLSSLAERTKLSLTDTNTDFMWICNEGYPIQSFNSTTEIYCLCPPNYYGDYCQYQSERLTVIIKIQLKYYIDPLTVFRFIVSLINENHQIISHDEIVQSPFAAKDRRHSKFFVHLIDERMINRSLYERLKSKFVRIDSYIINETNVRYISSWFYNVSFPFLPMNRLVEQILLEDEPVKIRNCKKTCGYHGKCMFYVNSDKLQYCWCDQGWFGEQCHLKSSLNVCNQTSCAPDSQCMIINDKKQEMKCICPLGKFGKQCYIKYNRCLNVHCQYNGTCLPLDQRILSYICVCEYGYTGKNCKDKLELANIFVPANISTLSSIPAIVIIFGYPYNRFLRQRSQRIYEDVPLPFNLEIASSERVGLARIFYNKSTNYYYLIAIGNEDLDAQINTTVISKNLCQNITEILNQTILNEYSYLKRIKFYHLPCQQNKELRCFFDEYQMCFCTKDHYSDCYGFHHDSFLCNYCQNNGLCLKLNPEMGQWNFFCKCSKCSSGHFCQLTTENYYINLDILIGKQLKSDNVSFHQQPFIIHLTLAILILILILSLIFNLISIIIFSNKKLREVGCDLYLLSLTIISQIGLILLFLRYLYTIFSQIYIIENQLFNQISCKILEYSTRLIPSIFDWFTVCISIERAYTITKDVHFTKLVALKTLKLSRWIIFIVIVCNILTTLHRPFYLRLIDVPSLKSEISGHSWCILDLKQTGWNTYEKFINIIHLVVPFLLNITSIILFLLSKIKLELTTTLRTEKKSKFVLLKEQIIKYKPLIISTMIIIILEIPRLLFTFILPCIEYSWQRYMYLTAYLISFLPLMGIFFIYIVPSPKYKTEYQRIMKKGFCKYFYRFN